MSCGRHPQWVHDASDCPICAADRAIRPFNQLSPAEAERLAWLSEECGEVIQVISKVLRHGYASHNPNDERPDNPNPETNREYLARELGHVLAALHVMSNAADINHARVFQSKAWKLAGVQKWMHHQVSKIFE